MPRELLFSRLQPWSTKPNSIGWAFTYHWKDYRHAGYSYSGPCAAWAYKALDLSAAKRVFIFGPSHTYPLGGCALTTFEKYATPFGDFTVDEPTIKALRETGKFADIPARNDLAEHSLEMHLPYLWKRCEQTFGRPAAAEQAAAAGDSTHKPWPTIVPIMVGNNREAAEKEFGDLLAPYLKDPSNVFVVSSDFCHWGSRFDYTAYLPESRLTKLKHLSRREARPTEPPIHESISALDHIIIDAIETGDHKKVVRMLAQTGNTVCGRHPIGVMMAMLEALVKEDGALSGQRKFKFIQYQRSSLVEDPSDSSVSYASAYAVV